MSLTKLTTDIVRWGIIGCGDVTEVKSGPAYQLTKGFELYAVMRRDVAKAEDYARRHQVPKFYSNAHDLINDPEVDAVYIATPPDSHMYYALKVAEAGKPCCIEKPMAPNYKESLAIRNAFDAKKLPLFIAYYRRTLPRFTKIKTWLDDGEIGEIRTVQWTLHKPPSQIDLSQEFNWRTDVKVAPGGYFDDLASHGLDLFSYLLGDYDQVQGIGINQQNLYSALDAVTACWSHYGGVTGCGSWNFGACDRQDSVVISGSRGFVKFSVFDEAPIVVCNEQGEREFFVENPVNIQFHHVNNMASQLFAGRPHPSNGVSATHTAWVMDKILGRIGGQ